MKITLYDKITPEFDQRIIDEIWRHNGTFSPVTLDPIRVIISTDSNKIIGGLIGQTWWKGLEIQYLFIDESHRRAGLGCQLLAKAESEGIKRGCQFSYVDTFDFQAREFYEKQGYKKYGELNNYANYKFIRYYLSKNLTMD